MDYIMDSLLAKISQIHKRNEENNKSSGENFNIFNILDLSTKELSHSKIIASLLDPQGIHEKGSRFLEIFCECIGIVDFSSDNIIIETEKFIGFIPDTKDSGGRIDIVLTKNRNNMIFIENKINAEDQENQLLRYHNYNPKAKLLYLTRLGVEPSDFSKGESCHFDYQTISYRKDILNWLERCRDSVTDNPLLRGTLTQYIILIKKLTELPWRKTMEQDLLDIIVKNTDNISAALIIAKNINLIKYRILKEKFIPIIEKLIQEKEGLNFEILLDPYKEQNNPIFSICRKKWSQIKICFYFESKNFEGMYYALIGVKLPDELKEKYKQKLNYGSNDPWQLWKYIREYRDRDDNFLLDLYNHEDRIKNIFEDKIDELLSILDEAKEMLF